MAHVVLLSGCSAGMSVCCVPAPAVSAVLGCAAACAEGSGCTLRSSCTGAALHVREPGALLPQLELAFDLTSCCSFCCCFRLAFEILVNID